MKCVLRCLALALLLPLLLMPLSCSQAPAGFSRAEKALIGQEGLMRVWTVDDPGDLELLRTKSVDLPESEIRSAAFARLAGRMLATVQSPEQDGVGIAAPQVGLNRRVVAVQRFDKDGEPFEVYANIHIDSLWGGLRLGSEGCLSVPGKRGEVARYDSVAISWNDGRSVCRDTIGGFTAVIFQHEVDHLEGILYIDKAESLFAE